MKPLVKYAGLFFEKGNRIHLYFWLALLTPPALLIIIRHDTTHIPGALACYLVILAAVYAGRWLCRKWLLTKKWGSLLLDLLVIMVCCDALGTALYVYFFVPDLPYNHIMESAINILVLVLLFIFSGFFIAVTRTAISEKMNGLRLAEQQKSSELSLLQSQVSPHFLFNTLNNLYSLSVHRPEKMPALLLKLSDLVRYSVYDAGQPLISLKEELEYIRNYIDLECIRMSDRLMIKVDINDPPHGVNIAPMLLIVFVENAFKHAKNTLNGQIRIAIEARVDDDTIHFNVCNSWEEDLSKDRPGNRYSGFGIDNVIKRLDLLYPGGYSLKQEKQNGVYKTALTIKTRYWTR